MILDLQQIFFQSSNIFLRNDPKQVLYIVPFTYRIVQGLHRIMALDIEDTISLQGEGVGA